MKLLNKLDANRIARDLLEGVREARAQVGNWVANDRRPNKSQLWFGGTPQGRRGKCAR
jgi:hypothetical protein